MSDWLHALRRLRRAPGFAAAVILTLALGIGATTATFSLAAAVWLRPLPYPHASRLVNIWVRHARAPRLLIGPGPATARRIRRLPALAATAAYSAGPAVWRISGQRVQAGTALVAPNLFQFLGVHAAAGRLFAASSSPAAGQASSPANPLAALVSPALAARLGGRQAALDQTISSAGLAFTVVGVVPAHFRFPTFIIPGFPVHTEIWLPLTAANRAVLTGMGSGSISLLARLRPRASLAQLQGELATVPAGTGQASSLDPAGFVAERLSGEVVGSIRTPLLLLFLAALLVLAIAIANAAHLLLERAWRGGAEISLRLALGASPGAVRRHALAESLLLAFAGGGLGLLLASLGLSAFRALAPSGWLPAEARGNGPLALYACAAAIVVGLVAGWLPARRAMRCDPEAVLRGTSGGITAAATSGSRQSLLTAEIALATILLAGAILLLQSFAAVARIPTGMDARRVISLYFLASPRAFPRPAQRAAFLEDLLRRLAAVPGVSSAALTTAPVLAGMTFIEPPARTARGVVGDYVHRGITPGYFQVLGIPLLRGRAFTPADGRASAPVIIINRAMARAGWPGENPVGQTVRLAGVKGKFAAWRVVGVVANARDNRLRSAAPPEIYTPLLQLLPAAMSCDVLVRTRASPAANWSYWHRALERQIWAAAGPIPIQFFSPLGRVLAKDRAAPAFRAAVLAGFAVLGLILAAFGVYAVFAYSVTRRRRELGIRLALGATPSGIIRMLLASGVRAIAAGAGIGILSAFLAARLARSVLFGVRPADPVALLGGALVLVVVALLACYLPARRALRLDPARILHEP